MTNDRKSQSCNIVKPFNTISSKHACPKGYTYVIEFGKPGFCLDDNCQRHKIYHVPEMVGCPEGYTFILTGHNSHIGDIGQCIEDLA